MQIKKVHHWIKYTLLHKESENFMENICQIYKKAQIVCKVYKDNKVPYFGSHSL